MEATVVTLALLVCLAASEPLLLNKETLPEAVASGKPCFVKFFAPWQVLDPRGVVSLYCTYHCYQKVWSLQATRADLGPASRGLGQHYGPGREGRYVLEKWAGLEWFVSMVDSNFRPCNY